MKTGKRILAIFLVVLMLVTSNVLNADNNLFITNASAYTNNETITFGSYPQKQVTDEALINILNAKAEWTSYDYEDTSMSYSDISYLSKQYRGVIYHSYRPACICTEHADIYGSTYISGKLETAYWYEYAPIQWQIVDAANGLIASKIVLDSQPWGFHSDGKAPTFENSSIKDWLNSTFLSTAFLKSDQRIISSIIVPDADVDRKLSGAPYTDYYVSQGGWSGDSWYWINRPWRDRYIDVNSTKYDTAGCCKTNVGIRPVMTVELDGLYNEKTDTWSFKNPNDIVSYKMFQTAHPGLSKKQAKEYANHTGGGLCYGMTGTAIALNSTYQSPADFNANYVVDINKKDISQSLNITALDYIKYMQCSQVHPYCYNQTLQTENDLNALYNAVKDYEAGIGAGVNIGISGRYYGNQNHSIWAISATEYDSNISILVYDSNHPNEKRYLTINKDQDNNLVSWSYEMFDGFVGIGKTVWGTEKKNACISFNTYSESFYGAIPTLISHYNSSSKIKSSDDGKYNIAKIEQGCEILSDAHKIKLFGVTEKTDIEGNPEDDIYCENEETLYWVKADNINLVNKNGKTVSFIGSNDKEIILDKASGNIAINIEEGTAKIGNCDSESLVMKFIGPSTNNNVQLSISGSVNSQNVFATETSSGITVSGISDGTVAISKDSKIIAEEEISCADGEIEIIYDKTGEENYIVTDYDESHTDKNHDGKCDSCGASTGTSTPTQKCSCNCHKSGFMGFIWKIQNFFNKIFKKNPVCACGAKHY